MFGTKWKFVYQAVDAAGCCILSGPSQQFALFGERNFQILSLLKI